MLGCSFKLCQNLPQNVMTDKVVQDRHCKMKLVLTNLPVFQVIAIYDCEHHKEPLSEEGVHQKEMILDDFDRKSSSAIHFVTPFINVIFFTCIVSLTPNACEWASHLPQQYNSACRTLSWAWETKTGLFLWFLTYWRSEWNFTWTRLMDRPQQPTFNKYQGEVRWWRVPLDVRTFSQLHFLVIACVIVLFGSEIRRSHHTTVSFIGGSTGATGHTHTHTHTHTHQTLCWCLVRAQTPPPQTHTHIHTHILYILAHTPTHTHTFPPAGPNRKPTKRALTYMPSFLQAPDTSHNGWVFFYSVGKLLPCPSHDTLTEESFH